MSQNSKSSHKRPKLTFPVPSLGREVECRKDIIRILTILTKYKPEVYERGLSDFLYERKTSQAPNGYMFSTLTFTTELKHILRALNSKNKYNIVGTLVEPVECILSYIYEMYKLNIDARNMNIDSQHMKIKTNKAIYNKLLINNTPEYILKDAQRKATKTSRPWLILSAVQYMREMPQWWYDWVDKYALFWVYAPPKDLPNFHDKLMMSYGNMEHVKIIPSQGALKLTL